MTTNPFIRRLLPWALIGLLSLAAAFGAIKAVGIALENNYQAVLEVEATRRALEINALTINSNVMGSVAALGLINQPAKSVVRGVTPLDHPSILEVLQSIGESYQASGVFVVGKDGIVQSSWDASGKSSSGLDVKFRPYFQIAMQGRQNIYAAVSLSQGRRAIYFSAPLYDEASTKAPVIGVASARLELDRIDAALRAWVSGPALVVSPHGVTFASNRNDLNEHLIATKTPEQMKNIRELKQFGKVFDGGVPTTLPFDIGRKTVSFENHRYAVARAPVQWNDASGEWTLVLLGDLDALLPAGEQTLVGASSGTLMLVLSSIFLAWRRRLAHANVARQRAEAELRSYAGTLEEDSETKTYLADVSNDLHRAVSLSDFARKFMFHIVPKVAADFGIFYVCDQESLLLVPVGGHGVPSDSLEKVTIGQGLVGQCAKDKTPIVISDMEETEIRIIWGNGSVAPKSIILLPLVQGDRLLGVILLAALRKVDSAKRALLDTLLPTVVMNLEILERSLNTQRQAEALQQQQIRLQETESWYRGIVQSSPDGMLVADEHGVIILANTRLQAMFGYGDGALIGQKVELLVPAAVRAHHPGLRANFLRAGITRTMGGINKELRGVRQDGSEFPVEVSLSALPAFGARGACVCAAVRDVTEQKQAGLAIRENEARLRGILDDSPTGVTIVSLEGEQIYVNRRLAQLFRVSPEDLKKWRATEFWRRPEDREAFIAVLKRDGKVSNLEAAMRRADGDDLWVLLNTNFVDLEGGRFLLSWFYDITERKRAEQALKASADQIEARTRELAEREAYFRTIFENSGSGIVSRSRDLTKFHANKAYLDFTGYTHEELSKLDTLSLMHEEDRGPAREHLARLRSGEISSFRLQRRYIRKDGSMRWADVVVSAILDTENSYLGSVTIVNDITASKQAENAIREAKETAVDATKA
jgi:PAS domain S-box-containing protein